MAAKVSMEMPGGLRMPVVGLGTWQADNEKELEVALDAALEIGYRHIDTAFIYGNENVIGRVLKKWFTSGKLKREDIFITTKLPMQGVHPDRVETFMKNSLENLQLDYVDLYLIHFPIGVSTVDDGSGVPKRIPEATDHLAVWKKMEEQVDAGRAKTIGVSNFNEVQIARILKSSRIKPACLQVEIHVYLQQRKLVQYCHDNGIVVVAYSPLGSPGSQQFFSRFGVKTKKLPNILQDEVVKGIAGKYNKSNAQVLLRYLIQRNIVVIPKSVTPTRLKENINIFDFTLDSEDMEKLSKLEVGEDARVCDFKFLGWDRTQPEWPFPK